MLKKFKTIKFRSTPRNAKWVEPDRGFQQLTLEDAALAVMTDHRIEKAPVCHLGCPIDIAIKQMGKENCNMLLAEDKEGNIVGLITSIDISGEKAVQFTTDTSKKHSDVKVGHLMTKIQDIPALTIEDALTAQVGDILHTLNEIGSEYALVTMQESKQIAVRGVFSARNIAKELKIFFDPSPGARTFAEFTKALHGSSFAS